MDDNVQVMLRFGGGAKANLWASQIAVGNENNLTLRIYGEKGGLSWRQEDPNHIVFTPLQQQPRIITRGGPGVGAAAAHASRIPSGHPEGYFEAFAQLYTDLADQIAARVLNQTAPPASEIVPDVKDGLTGMRFIDAVLRSSKNNSAWTSL